MISDILVVLYEYQNCTPAASLHYVIQRTCTWRYIRGGGGGGVVHAPLAVNELLKAVISMYRARAAALPGLSGAYQEVGTVRPWRSGIGAGVGAGWGKGQGWGQWWGQGWEQGWEQG